LIEIPIVAIRSPLSRAAHSAEPIE